MKHKSIWQSKKKQLKPNQLFAFTVKWAFTMVKITFFKEKLPKGLFWTIFEIAMLMFSSSVSCTTQVPLYLSVKERTFICETVNRRKTCNLHNLNNLHKSLSFLYSSKLSSLLKCKYQNQNYTFKVTITTYQY